MIISDSNLIGVTFRNEMDQKVKELINGYPKKEAQSRVKVSFPFGVAIVGETNVRFYENFDHAYKQHHTGGQRKDARQEELVGQLHLNKAFEEILVEFLKRETKRSLNTTDAPTTVLIPDPHTSMNACCSSDKVIL
eukprot:CAMPEP_0171467684 /NCGR_PEP_ID=MMETSP0945-20130129/10133_1 /TAXON_ID=109269 /ORGANISM="Vaucheria litorea, Strain CCMP2940" /LENGTH=135 /DNA_ID=CAMNT_0011996279 /DNA_START=555 /DNA_END=962 /DNA_ORIENTATION=-